MSPCHEQAQQELPFVFFAMAFGQIHLNEPLNCDMPGFDDILPLHLVQMSNITYLRPWLSDTNPELRQLHLFGLLSKTTFRASFFGSESGWLCQGSEFQFCLVPSRAQTSALALYSPGRTLLSQPSAAPSLAPGAWGKLGFPRSKRSHRRLMPLSLRPSCRACLFFKRSEQW